MLGAGRECSRWVDVEDCLVVIRAYGYWLIKQFVQGNDTSSREKCDLDNIVA